MFWFNVLPLNDTIDSTGDTNDIILIKDALNR